MAPSNIPWLTQPDLFLLSQGGVAQVWKCKRTISAALMMKRNDFVYKDDVQNHLDLIESMFEWAENDYKELIKYITERRLLVNSQGLVIAELPIFGLDGKMNESVSPLFMWSIDIIALDTYMQHYMVRPIPFRPIQYLEDKNGPARDVQEVELSPNELKLTAELEKENDDKKALDKEVADLNIKKKGLVDQVAKLEKDLAEKTKEANAEQQELDRVKSQLEGRVGDLEAKNRVLEGRIAQLTAELTDLRRRIVELRQQLIGANTDKVALDQKIVELQNQHDTLINNKNKPAVDPSWMTNNYESDWVDYYGLQKKASYPTSAKVGLIITSSGTNFGEDNTTNVGRNLFCGVKYDKTIRDMFFGQLKVADIARMGSAGYAKARFNPRIWGFCLTMEKSFTLSGRLIKMDGDRLKHSISFH